jgi:hypothetical protein
VGIGDEMVIGWKAADVSNAAKAGGAGAEGIGTGIDID